MSQLCSSAAPAAVACSRARADGNSISITAFPHSTSKSMRQVQVLDSVRHPEFPPSVPVRYESPLQSLQPSMPLINFLITIVAVAIRLSFSTRPMLHLLDWRITTHEHYGSTSIA